MFIMWYEYTLRFEEKRVEQEKAGKERVAGEQCFSIFLFHKHHSENMNKIKWLDVSKLGCKMDEIGIRIEIIIKYISFHQFLSRAFNAFRKSIFIICIWLCVCAYVSMLVSSFDVHVDNAQRITEQNICIKVFYRVDAVKFGTQLPVFRNASISPSTRIKYEQKKSNTRTQTHTNVTEWKKETDDVGRAKCQRYKCSLRLSSFYKREALALDPLDYICTLFSYSSKTVNYLGIYIKSGIDGKFCCWCYSDDDDDDDDGDDDGCCIKLCEIRIGGVCKFI